MSKSSTSNAAALIERGALLLDVREADEWSAGHVPGAVWIPMGALAKRVGELPKDREVVVICRSGHRSASVTDALRVMGIDATNLDGGLIAWASEGRAVVTDAGTTGTVI